MTNPETFQRAAIPAADPDVAALATALGVDTTGVPAAGVGGGLAIPWRRVRATPSREVSPITGLPVGPGLGTDPAGTWETKTLEEAKLDILRWTDARLEAFAQRLVAAGLLDPDYTRDDIEGVWEQLVDKAARHAAASRQVTPFDVIDLYARPAAGSKRATPSTVVSRRVELADPTTARKLLDSMLSADLGRRATETELDDFQAALNDAQRKAPQVSTTTTRYDASGRPIAADTTVTGGLDATGYTRDYVHDDPDMEREWRSYQAATTYAEALFEALRSPVGGS